MTEYDPADRESWIDPPSEEYQREHPGWDRPAGSGTIPEAEHWPDTIDAAAYHGPAGDVVHAIEPHTESDPVALLMHYLAFVGNCIGRRPYYQVEGDQHATNLFAALVGQSAKGRKGTARGRIASIFREADPDWEQLRTHSGMSSGEGLIWAVRDPIVTRTKKGEEETDPGVTDKRLMIVEPEFAGVLRVMQREGNILSRIIRDAWDRGNLATLTKHSPARATGALISIIGHITADELRQSLDRVEIANGFANRFLWLYVKRSKLLPHGGCIDTRVVADLGVRTRDAIEYARTVGRVMMTSAAASQWEIIYPKLSADRHGLMGAICARAEAQVIRLALLYSLLDQRREIAAEHLRAALAVWRYAEDSAQCIWGELLGDPAADTIMRALREAPNGLTRTEISALFGRHQSTTQIDRPLTALERQRRVVRTERTTGGRPAEVWQITGGR